MPNRVTASSSLLIGQWRNAVKLKALVDKFSAVLREQIEAPLDAVMGQRRIETARGYWLDCIGRTLGLGRPSVEDTGTRFGYDSAGSGFDQAPFAGHAGKAPLGDTAFRKLLRARAIAVSADGALDTFTRAVREIDPSAAVHVIAPMSLVCVTVATVLCELADAVGALPRTAGVRVQYVGPGSFGFDLAGVGFDQAPFGRHASVSTPSNALRWRGVPLRWRGDYLTWRA